MFDIKENLKKLPDSPGVYIHKDGLGQVIYVGKAISLKNRVRQYFQSSKNMDAKVRAMVGHIAEFEFISCATEMEAFILECNLIKQYRPKYNILLRDDKTYPYIKVTMSEQWPRIVKTRIVKKDGDRYFGPYSDVGAVNQMVDFLNELYSLKRCKSRAFPAGHRPCLNYHIGTCAGICTGNADHEGYMEKIELVLDYLKGKTKSIESYLKEKMDSAAGELNYEDAAKYRDHLASAKALHETQRVVLSSGKDMDVVLAVGDENIVTFFVRDGKLIGRETYSMRSDDAMKKENAELPKERVSEFLRQHYGQMTDGPGEILLEEEPSENVDMMETYLADIWGHNVDIHVPRRGEKKAVLDLALKDAEVMREGIKEREQSKQERMQGLAEDMAAVLVEAGYGRLEKKEEYRVEAYDISNTNGVDSVGGMVVFNGLRKDKKSYRRFKIRTVDGPDDYTSMKEVIYRRLRRLEERDAGFSVMPDALLIDGGKGHIAAVREVLEAMGMDIPVLGMVKDDHHRTRGLVYMIGEDFHEIDLKERPLLFKYMGTVQEEVHRFSIDYHRGLRDKGKLTSVLDEVEGIGPVKRNALLRHFGSVENIKKASIENIMSVPGITEKNAKAISQRLGPG